ncbi:MAG: hypothetical protein HRT36_07565 [Alphaproteobacteria bacterium]|nr:hypothetical protein [Alphaproteobacteria bacterium]
MISAMKYMLQIAGSDQKNRKAIKENQLIGIERRTDMFTLFLLKYDDERRWEVSHISGRFFRSKHRWKSPSPSSQLLHFSILLMM